MKTIKLLSVASVLMAVVCVPAAIWLPDDPLWAGVFFWGCMLWVALCPWIVSWLFQERWQ